MRGRFFWIECWRVLRDICCSALMPPSSYVVTITLRRAGVCPQPPLDNIESGRSPKALKNKKMPLAMRY